MQKHRKKGIKQVTLFQVIYKKGVKKVVQLTALNKKTNNTLNVNLLQKKIEANKKLNKIRVNQRVWSISASTRDYIALRIG